MLYGVLRVTWVNCWVDWVGKNIDHTWLLMRGHTQVGTRLHTGNLDVGTVEGWCDDDARSPASHRSAGKEGRGRPRKVSKIGSPPPPPTFSPPPPPIAHVGKWVQKQA